MKHIRIVDDKGPFTMSTKTTVGELMDRFDSKDIAYAAINMLIQMDHICDVCQSEEDVRYSRNEKEHLCSSCIEEY